MLELNPPSAGLRQPRFVKTMNLALQSDTQLYSLEDKIDLNIFLAQFY